MGRTGRVLACIPGAAPPVHEGRGETGNHQHPEPALEQHTIPRLLDLRCLELGEKHHPVLQPLGGLADPALVFEEEGFLLAHLLEARRLRALPRFVSGALARSAHPSLGTIGLVGRELVTASRERTEGQQQERQGGTGTEEHVPTGYQLRGTRQGSRTRGRSTTSRTLHRGEPSGRTFHGLVRPSDQSRQTEPGRPLASRFNSGAKPPGSKRRERPGR
jgi:hypothetical protein